MGVLYTREGWHAGRTLRRGARPPDWAPSRPKTTHPIPPPPVCAFSSRPRRWRSRNDPVAIFWSALPGSAVWCVSEDPDNLSSPWPSECLHFRFVTHLARPGFDYVRLRESRTGSRWTGEVSGHLTSIWAISMLIRPAYSVHGTNMSSCSHSYGGPARPSEEIYSPICSGMVTASRQARGATEIRLSTVDLGCRRHHHRKTTQSSDGIQGGGHGNPPEAAV